MSAEYSVRNTDSVENALDQVIAWFPGKFSDINRSHIQVIFKDAPVSPWRASVKLLKGVTQALTDKKIALVVWKGDWEASDEYQRGFLLYEQLLKIFYDDEKKQYKLRKPDVQTFSETIALFGLNGEKVKEVFDKVSQK